MFNQTFTACLFLNNGFRSDAEKSQIFITWIGLPVFIIIHKMLYISGKKILMLLLYVVLASSSGSSSRTAASISSI